MREHAAEAGDGAGAGGDPPAAAQLLMRGATVQPGRQQDQPRGRDLLARHGVQHDLGAEAVSADHRPRAEHLARETGEHIGEPVLRVGVVRALLGVAVQRQVGQHDAEAVGELLDNRLELLVREHRRVQQRQRRAGPRLPVCDARTVTVVVEP